MMEYDNPLFDRVDSLTQRKRVFVARAARTTSEQATDDDEIPTLTEEIDLDALACSSGPIDSPPIEQVVDSIRSRLAEELQQRLAKEIPAVVSEATDRLVTELQGRLRTLAEEWLRDYPDQWKQIQLPLETTDSSGALAPPRAPD